MSRAAEPLDAWVARVFVRREGLYPVSMPAADDLKEHAASNPGTLRIEDMKGTVLWPEGSMQ